MLINKLKVPVITKHTRGKSDCFQRFAFNLMNGHFACTFSALVSRSVIAPFCPCASSVFVHLMSVYARCVVVLQPQSSQWYAIGIPEQTRALTSAFV